ncbi:MAG: arginine--tRNA ligase [Thermoplasmatota archaeon]
MNYFYFKIQQHITSSIERILKDLSYPTDIKVEIPPDPTMGDFSFPCFSLCKTSKKSPYETAKMIAERLSQDESIKSIEVQNGYINFHINEQQLMKETIPSILTKKDRYGTLQKKKQRVIVEHTSANPNGPLHIGRARNPIIGDTLVRLFKAAGYICTSQFYLDDLGKQVAILCWGLNNLKKEDIPAVILDKPDHHAVGFYQKAYALMTSNLSVEQEINDIIIKSERGDKKNLALIHSAYQPVLEGMNESLNRINIKIDKYVPESTFVKNGDVETVITLLKKTPYCHNEDGAYYLDLESFGIHGRNTRFFITRGDGTSLYATRDIAYHVWKATQADLLINVLGEDHKLESKQVEIGLRLLNEKHLPQPVFYSFVSLPEGKMSTRRGRVVYLDDLIDECVGRAYEEVAKRRKDELAVSEMKDIAMRLALGAIRYNIIKVQPEKDMVFTWEEALNFEGNAAPFVQYAHARASGILKKNTTVSIDTKKHTYKALQHPSEVQLVKNLGKLPVVIKEASSSFRPHLIAAYIFETASLFNQFYRDCPVLNETHEDIKKARLGLVAASKQVLHNGLSILGIDALEEM